MIKKQECEAQMIMLCVVEAEADRDITLHRLDPEDQRLEKKPVPMSQSKKKKNSTSLPLSVFSLAFSDDSDHRSSKFDSS